MSFIQRHAKFVLLFVLAMALGEMAIYWLVKTDLRNFSQKLNVEYIYTDESQETPWKIIEHPVATHFDEHDQDVVYNYVYQAYIRPLHVRFNLPNFTLNLTGAYMFGKDYQVNSFLNFTYDLAREFLTQDSFLLLRSGEYIMGYSIPYAYSEEMEYDGNNYWNNPMMFPTLGSYLERFTKDWNENSVKEKDPYKRSASLIVENDIVTKSLLEGRYYFVQGLFTVIQVSVALLLMIFYAFSVKRNNQRKQQEQRKERAVELLAQHQIIVLTQKSWPSGIHEVPITDVGYFNRRLAEVGERLKEFEGGTITIEQLLSEQSWVHPIHGKQTPIRAMLDELEDLNRRILKRYENILEERRTAARLESANSVQGIPISKPSLEIYRELVQSLRQKYDDLISRCPRLLKDESLMCRNVEKIFTRINEGLKQDRVERTQFLEETITTLESAASKKRKRRVA